MKTTGGRIQEMPSQLNHGSTYMTTPTSSSLWSKPVVNKTGTGVVTTGIWNSSSHLSLPLYTKQSSGSSRAKKQQRSPHRTAGQSFHLVFLGASVSAELTNHCKKGWLSISCAVPTSVPSATHTLPFVLAAAATPAQHNLSFLL